MLRISPNGMVLRHQFSRARSMAGCLAVLYLDPVIASAGAIGPIPPLGYHALQPELTGRTEQVRADLALFKRRDEVAVRPGRSISLACHASMRSEHLELRRAIRALVRGSRQTMATF